MNVFYYSIVQTNELDENNIWKVFKIQSIPKRTHLN